MRNDFEILDDRVLIKINSSKEYAIISLASFELVSSVPGMWSASSGYVISKTYVDHKVSRVSLHRLITQAPTGMVVDHINHNPLDNRIENLRVITRGQNLQNRKGAQSNSKSGIRGVMFDEKRNKWIAAMILNGKKKFIGSYSSPEQAEEAAIKARKEMMPFYVEVRTNGS